MIFHHHTSGTEIKASIRNARIMYAGNMKLKIFGTLSCASGKRMKPQNRVFFQSRAEAKEKNFRPCGHCMKADFKKWKDGSV
jgi:methylphosphotriester-DNA--protein-cysteine methyltransferase